MPPVTMEEERDEAGRAVPERVTLLRQQYERFPINTKPAPDLKRELRPGFLLPYLFEVDARVFGRWEYWTEAMGCQSVPGRPIPPVDWLGSPHARTRKMLETALDAVPKHGSWRSMGGWEYFRYLLQWMLWGFGHPGYGEPTEPPGCEGASLRLYQVLNLGPWMLWPFDYLGELLAENAYGKTRGFFPTPMHICLMMASMLMGSSGADLRLEAVCDPAVGTGRLLLAASGYSLRLYGCDIDQTMCMATLVNGYLFAPWMAKPFPFLDAADLDPGRAEAVSDQAGSQEPPNAEVLAGDAGRDVGEVSHFLPIRKRGRRGEDAQGTLF
jgi:hypothetical protein